ncbi:MAG: transposase [Lactobacillus delbrueckii]|nr:transposase [Lactobacillus delbrueckii]
MTKKHQVLRQIDSVTDMAAKCINYFVYHPSKDFTRKRKLDAKTFIKTALAMQLNKELADAFPKPSKRMTASAYEQQKSKVNPRLFKAILYEFRFSIKTCVND